VNAGREDTPSSLSLCACEPGQRQRPGAVNHTEGLFDLYMHAPIVIAAVADYPRSHTFLARTFVYNVISSDRKPS
jgi:hypothetical protein